MVGTLEEAEAVVGTSEEAEAVVGTSEEAEAVVETPEGAGAVVAKRCRCRTIFLAKNGLEEGEIRKGRGQSGSLRRC